MKQIWTTPTILISSAIGTIVWLLICVVGLPLMGRIPDECSASISCLTLEGWGTFLSGVFAPIAFLWLIVTVLIQVRELGLQREELKLTRQEFEENRVVAQEQARHIEAQTDVLVREQADRQMEMHLRLLGRWSLDKLKTWDKNRDVLKFRLLTDVPASHLEFALSLAEKIGNDSFFVDLDDKIKPKYDGIYREDLEAFNERLDEIIALRPKVSPAYGAVIGDLERSLVLGSIPDFAKALPSYNDSDF